MTDNQTHLDEANFTQISTMSLEILLSFSFNPSGINIFNGNKLIISSP